MTNKPSESEFEQICKRISEFISLSAEQLKKHPEFKDQLKSTDEKINEISENIKNILCEQFKTDPEFQKTIKTIIGIKSRAKKERNKYDLFGRLGELDNDMDKLRQELLEKNDDELVIIAASQRKLGTRKSLKNMERTEIVEKLIQYIHAEIERWA